LTKNNSREEGPVRKIPAARVQFLPEDRAWITERIDEVLSTGMLTLGKYGKEFEKGFARLCAAKHAISVNSGTSALEIGLRTLGVEGKDVIVPTNTFFATAAAVVHAGANPVLVDMDPESFAIRPEDVVEALTPNTAGIVVVHIGGLISARMPELQEMASQKGLWLMEDAAHAHGSSHRGIAAGTFGVAAGFSMYPTKVMTSVEGGMLVTNDDRIAGEALIYRDQGKANFLVNAHTRMGYNWRMSEPHAIVGLKHLERLPRMIADRQEIAAYYDKALAGFGGLRPLKVPDGGVCNYYKYIAVMSEARDRKELKKQLKEEYGVSLSGEVYEDPLHQQPVFEQYAREAMPVSEDLCGRHICLPLYAGMEIDEAKQVIESLREFFE